MPPQTQREEKGDTWVNLTETRGAILAGSRRPWSSGDVADMVQGCTACPAPEVIMINPNFQSFLLRHRTSVADGGKDPGPWTGWHIPGGFMPAGMSFKDKIFDICKEDADLDPEDVLEIIGVIGIGEWNDPALSTPHSYGNPLSVITVVIVNEHAVDVGDRTTLKWCHVENGIPDGMIDTGGRHEAFLNRFSDWAKGGKGVDCAPIV